MYIQRMIENIKLNWSEGEAIETRRGPRILKVAQPTAAFWGAWRSSKSQLQAEGVSCRKNRDDAWEICWWLEASPQTINTQPAVAESLFIDPDFQKG